MANASIQSLPVCGRAGIFDTRDVSLGALHANANCCFDPSFCDTTSLCRLHSHSPAKHASRRYANLQLKAMASSGLIGISVTLTLQNPPNTVVEGLVANVNPLTSTLTLQNGKHEYVVVKRLKLTFHQFDFLQLVIA